MNKYCVVPMSIGVFEMGTFKIWHDNLKTAAAEAERLGEFYRVDVVVCKVVATYAWKAKWKESENDANGMET